MELSYLIVKLPSVIKGILKKETAVYISYNGSAAIPVLTNLSCLL